MILPIAPVYSAITAGLRAYTRALRVQLKNTNVKVVELIAPGSGTPLNDKFRKEAVFDPDPRMLTSPQKIVDAAINGLLNNKNEVYPGKAGLVYLLSRIAPGFLLNQAAKMGASVMYNY
ncbi:hypothetical protein ABDD95_12980 [Mucilaginibacter sp. PAMB04274]|uniref:hypothetical protein n=1 Tax=Mucilaginibacter sp. PAMB04274 TaxID=3138568 RepID=UPI003329A640